MYECLEGADFQGFQNLAGLVAVADVLKGLGGILAGDIEKDFLTTAA
jgi:hypothetical protein